MNTEHLRHSLKILWLSYYRANRDWLVKLGIWVNCEGQRRPSSSFILATLALLEPDLLALLPLIVDLSSNPDRIVIALGLNFNPDDALEELEAIESPIELIKYLPSSTAPVHFPSTSLSSVEQPSIDPIRVEATPEERQFPQRENSEASPSIQKDNACEGVGPNPSLRYERTN